MNTYIQKGCINPIKGDSKYILILLKIYIA